jgi:hypothetical protein
LPGALVKLKEHIVDRKKPTLTSPWKVGFLVALLLVVTALGVSYLITGTFGIKWHWIETGGLSPTTWTFHFGAFLEEMAPLLLITSLLAFGAYVLVAGAVRRYKAYVDSGAEYKQLLKSIKGMEDLEAEDISDRLKGHPELREFLMGVKRRAAALESANSDRLARHTQGAHQAPANSVSRDTVASECNRLVEAIDAGRDNFPREIELTIPELKQIERTLRRVFAETPQAPVTDTSAGALEELRNSVRSTVDALRSDVIACASGAREVEQAVATLQGQNASVKPPSTNAAAVQKRVDAVAEALTMLGEETKRIAIASAFQASGGPESDHIKVADELKVLATRFNTVARHWGETVPALKEIIAGGGNQAAPTDAGATAQAANRARLWGERAVAMNEHVRALERAVGITPSRPGASEPALAAVDLDTSSREPAVAIAPAARSADDDFVARNNAQMFGSEGTEDISFVDIPGFEKEHRFFADPPADPTRDADERFVVDNSHERRWDLSEEKTEAEPAAAATSAEARPAPDDGFLTGPRPTVSSQRVSVPAAAARAAAPQPAPQPAPLIEAEPESVATATLDPDADAVDLYAIGAIDCVQTV